MKRTTYLITSWGLGAGLVAIVTGILDSDGFNVYLGLVLLISCGMNIIQYNREVIK